LVDRSLWAARVVTLASFLDLFMQFPVVAPYAATLGASAVMVGAIVGMYSAANLAGNVLSGAVLDRWGRRGPLLGGLAATAAAVMLYVLARSPGQLLGVRAFHGFAAAILTVGAFTIMGDAARADHRARVMGRSGAVIGAAAVLGPPLAGALRDRVGFAAVFATVALLMLVALAAVWWWAPETATPSPSAAEPPGQSRGRFSGLVLDLIRRPRLAAAYLAALAYTVGLGVLVAHLALLMEKAGASGARIGMAFGTFALVAVVIMLSPLTHLSDRYGRRTPLATGLAFVAGGLLVLAAGAGAAAPGMAVFGFGFGLLFPSATALVAEATERTERGTAFGIFYALYSLGAVAGAGLAGAVTQWQGQVTGLPFLAAAPAVLLAVPAVLLWVPQRKG